MFTARPRLAAPPSCCCRRLISQNSVIATISPSGPCPCTPTRCFPAFPTLFPSSASCWAACTGLPTAAKKWPKPKIMAETNRRERVVHNDGSQGSLHLLESHLPSHHGGRRVCHLGPLTLRTWRLHQPQRSISLGPLDWFRRDVWRHARRRRIHSHRRRRDLQHQALALHHASHDSDRIHGLSAGVRRAHVRPRPAVEHLASADHAQSALGDV